MRKKTPKYCTSCGRVLELKLYARGYDAYTGKRKYQSALECPKYYSYVGEFGLVESHDKILI